MSDPAQEPEDVQEEPIVNTEDDLAGLPVSEKGVQRVPTIEVVGSAGKIVINQSELEYYRSRGYVTASETTKETVETKALHTSDQRKAMGDPTV